MELTKKKKDILKHLINGERIGDIAEELNLAVGTVRCHLREMRLMLRAKTTAELINIAYKEGII